MAKERQDIRNIITGTFTIKQVLALTQQFYRNRFNYKDRDVTKSFKIKKIQRLKTDRPGQPTIKYVITSSSFPQYKPYADLPGGTNTSVKHQYDITIEADRLSLNTRNWKARTGSIRSLPRNIPYTKIQAISNESKERVRKRMESMYSSRTKKFRETKYKEELNKIRKTAQYKTKGDYIAQVYGINLDFFYRCMHIFGTKGHLFGPDRTNGAPTKTNPYGLMFFDKHLLRGIELLMNFNILKDD